MSDSVKLKTLAFVLPRYGRSLGGGAETLAREIALQLVSGKYKNLVEVDAVEVWTTCASDHRTWENALKPGKSEEDGLIVYRFPVDERDLETFIKAELNLQQGFPLSPEEQLNWLAAGVNSSELYQFIAENAARVSAIIFAPYLFPTSFWGALICPEKSLLIPCLHDEAYAYQAAFRHVFKSVRGLLFNAPEEAALALELFGREIVESKASVVGMGFEDKKFQKTNNSKIYLLYSGRKEQGKNLDLLIQWFSEARKRFLDLELLLIGSGEINFLKQLPEGVKDCGFVSEVEKAQLMSSALAICQLSVNESFSIVLMESWLQEIPCIVHARSRVTRDHVERSSGGLFVDNQAEFVQAVRLLYQDRDLAKRLGQAGRNYVLSEYSWPSVMSRLARAFVKCGL